MTQSEQWFKSISQILIADEGLRLRPYKDSKGLWTIGVGYLIGENLQDLHITKETALHMLKEKISEAEEGLCQIFGAQTVQNWTPARRAALLSMMYTLGLARFQGFKDMIKAVHLEDWSMAAKEALDSKWAHDVDPRSVQGKGRDDRIAYMLKEGEYHEAYNFTS